MSSLSQVGGIGDSSEGYILIAKMDNAKNLSNVLKAVHFKDDATVFLSANGMKVTVEDGKCVQASAFVQATMFQEYCFKEDSATFKVNLNILLECLAIFGSGGKDSSSFSALKICYAGHGHDLRIMLVEEAGVLTDCSIRTQEPGDILDFNFSSADVVNKLIMKSSYLKDAFQELDTTSEVIQLLMSPDAPFFRISTFGYSGSSHADYPKDSEVIELFECSQTQTNRYKTTLLKPSVKALALSTKISIRTDSRGFLSFQYMVPCDDGKICFVEYLCAPDEGTSEGEFQDQ